MTVDPSPPPTIVSENLGYPSENLEYPYENLEPIPFRYGAASILLSAAAFQLLNQAVLRWLTPGVVAGDDLWKWRNLFISWVHAVIIGTWDLSW